MNNFQRGFTLIEVLVSIIILSVVVTGLFQMSSNNKDNFMYLEAKNTFDRLASLAFIHNNISLHNSDKSLYDIIRNDYEINDDELRKYLKEQEVHYDQEEFTVFNTLSDGNLSEEQQAAEENDEYNEANNSNFSFSLIYDKITISNKESSTYAYKIKIQE